MLKKRNEQVQFIVRVADALICIVAFFIAFQLRSIEAAFGFKELAPLAPLESVTWLLAASLVIHLFVYPYFGFYQSLRLKTVRDILKMVVWALVVEFFVLGSLVFFVQAKTTSRYFFALFLVVNYSLLLLEKVGGRVLMSTVRKRGYNYRQVLVCGMGPNASRVIRALQAHKHWGYVVAGILTAPGDPGTERFEGVQVLGRIEDLKGVLQARAVDEVYFALEVLDAALIAEQVALCEAVGIPARISLSMAELSGSKATFHSMGDIPIVTFYTTLMTPVEAFMKRAMDLVIGLMGLLITGALLPWIAWRIRKESPGPVFFRQLRIGENGRVFKCYKFRTMVVDAEARKQELVAANTMKGPIFKVENDPRIFKFGAFLRRTSLDELPQFLNIIRGDMSVVGTRPPTMDEVNRYEMRQRRRLSIRPGLTGLWQVSGRNEIREFDEVVKLDLEYIDHWSIWLDVKIIFKTIWVALFGKGAY